MPEMTYLTKMATIFKKMERAVIGTSENAPGYIAAKGDDESVTLTLNTAMLPHGAAAGPGVRALARKLTARFGGDAVTLEEPDSMENLDLGIPSAYRLTLTLPNDYSTLEQLAAAHKDVAVDYCQTALKGQTEDQLDYLAEQLGARQAAAVFAQMTGVEMRYREPDASISCRAVSRSIG